MTAVQKLNKRLQDFPEKEREALATALLEELETQAQDQPNEALPDYVPFPVKKRMAGLGKGTVDLAPDFDAPLPDSFWLGEA